jgi:hypothetical protein
VHSRTHLRASSNRQKSYRWESCAGQIAPKTHRGHLHSNTLPPKRQIPRPAECRIFQLSSSRPVAPQAASFSSSDARAAGPTVTLRKGSGISVRALELN